MKVFDDFGEGLHIEYGSAVTSKWQDMTIFHMHPQYELLLVWENTLNTTIINGKSIEIHHPMAILTAPFAMHHTYFREAKGPKVERCVLYFDDAFLESFGVHKPPVAELLGNANAVILNISGLEKKIRQMVLMLTEGEGKYGTRGNAANEIQNILTLAMIRCLYDHSEKGQSRVRISEKNYIIDVMEYIALHLNEDLTIPRIAEQFFISRDKLCRDFRRHVQMNVGDFISTARLNLAKKYLMENKLTIREISTRCGFENDVYFYSFFKRHEGCTPKEFSKRKYEEHLARHQNN
ncbi:MAG: helix-turn-helix transcriptional regulator [Clostridia bacterium]|nr:helix-turn-helix transcriptional regulator [Clostridia bacterium]